MATGAKYHRKCLVALYNRARQTEKKQFSHDKTDKIKHSIALAQLISFIEETRVDGTITPIFKLSELTRDYCIRLEQLGVKQEQRIHTTRLKEKLLTHIPGLSAHTKGREVLLAYDDDIAHVLASVHKRDNDSDAMCIAHVAQIIRRDLFDENEAFSGTFTPDCQIESVPTSMLSLVCMILEGPNIKDQTSHPTSQAALTIAQLLKFNSIKHKRQSMTSVKHVTVQETPLPLYIGTMLHSCTRKRVLVDKLYEL